MTGTPTGTRPDISRTVARYLRQRNDGPWSTPEEVRFLAAGEYNENHLVRTRDGDFVLRINHGSQLGLTDQITYEFKVLQNLSGTGLTPRPFFADPQAPDLGGVLLMEFLPGAPLDYRKDSAGAAGVFARVHAVPPGPHLIAQPDPVADVAAESLELLHRFPDHPLTKERHRLLRYRDEVLEMGGKTRHLFADDPHVLVNTEVNSGNFLVHEGTVRLVDWEKAVRSHPCQDLAHFLVPTTTRWKTDFTFDEAGRLEFLRAYREAAGSNQDLDALSEKTRVMERTILLRALSWCHMAHYEYTRPGRALTDPVTFERITRYLDEMECILR